MLIQYKICAGYRKDLLESFYVMEVVSGDVSNFAGLKFPSHIIYWWLQSCHFSKNVHVSSPVFKSSGNNSWWILHPSTDLKWISTFSFFRWSSRALFRATSLQGSNHNKSTPIPGKKAPDNNVLGHSIWHNGPKFVVSSNQKSHWGNFN